MTSLRHMQRYALFALLGVLSPALLWAGSTNTIRFAFQDRIGSLLPLVAVHKGYFRDAGLSVKPLHFSNGPACVEALYTGAADISTMGDTTAIITVTRNPRVRIFASHASGEHRHRLMVRQEAALNSLADLQGKRVAVKKGTSTYGGLLASLKEAQVNPAAIHLIDIAPATMLTALQAGAVDAFAASEPTPSLAEERGARELCTFGGLGNLYPIFMLARQDFMRTHAEEFKGFVMALRRAEQYAQTHPQEVVTLMAEQTSLSPKATRAALARHQFRLRLDEAIVHSLHETAAFLHRQGIIEQVPDWQQVVEPSVLVELHESKKE